MAGARARLLPVSGQRRPAGGSGPEAGRLWLGEVAARPGRDGAADPIFLVDAAAAGSAALEVGATPEGVAAACAPSARRTTGAKWWAAGTG